METSQQKNTPPKLAKLKSQKSRKNLRIVHKGLSCNEKLGFWFSKFWLYPIAIRLGFNKPRIMTVSEALFWIFCVCDFGLCIKLTLNSIVYNTLNKLYITSTFALHTGLLTGIFYAFVIFLSLRYPFYWRWGLIQIGFDRQMIWHKICAWLAVICCILHIIDYINFEDLFVWKAVSGWICYGFSILMMIFASTYFRRKHYNTLFINSHIIFALGFIIFGWLHNAILIIYGTFIVILDILLRLIDRKVRRITVTNVSMLDYDRVIRIDFEKKYFSYRAGQYVFIRCKEIGFEMHPFTISSYPSSGKIMTVYIKTFKKNFGGNWVDKLSNFVKAKQADKPDWFKNTSSFEVEGPFGESTLPQPIHEYNHVIFIGGGIGITPIDSLFNQLIYDLTEGNIQNAQVGCIDYIFTTRSKSLITEFASRNTSWQIDDGGMDDDILSSDGVISDAENKNNVDIVYEDHENDADDIDINFNKLTKDSLTMRIGSVKLENESYSHNSSIPNRKILHGKLQLSTDFTNINLKQLEEDKAANMMSTANTLRLGTEDFKVGDGKTGKIKLRRKSAKKADDDIDEENDLDGENLSMKSLDNMSVDTLDITNSTHITRVKDKTARKQYKKAFPFINFQRPNIRSIIYNAAAKTTSNNICVIVSGPKGMIRDCIKYGNEVGINVHYEVFDW